MDQEYKGRWYTAMLYGLLLLLIFGGCAKKAMVSERVIGTPEGSVLSPGETTDRAIETEYVIPQDQKIPVEGMIEEGELKETERVAKLAKTSIGFGDIFFDFDRDLIRLDARRVLEKNARILKDNPSVQTIIEGHADERGTNEYNIALGERRARAIKRYLEALGVDSSRIRTLSYGEEKPFCTESNESCWQQNRRGHFVQADY